MKLYTVTKSFVGSPDGNKRWAFTAGEAIAETDSRLSDALITNALAQGVFTESEVTVTVTQPLEAGSIIITAPIKAPAKTKK